MQSSQIDPSLTAINAGQKARFARHVADAYPKQLTLRAYLNAQGLSGSVAFALEAFSGECFRIGRRFSGPAAGNAALALSEKYADLGLDDGDLCAILSTVHGILLPTPAQVTLLTPVNGAPAEPKDGTLTWQAAAGASGYDVWLGPNVGPVIMVSSDQAGLSYAYSGLAGLTLHDWYVQARNACGTGTASATWQFTTVA